MPPHHLPRTRPVFLDLRQIRLPLSAIISIGHRLSGVLLFVFLPLLLWLWSYSLTPAGFAALHNSGWLLKLLGLLLLVLFSWHVAAGVRVMWLDWQSGAGLIALRRSAWLVLLCVGLALAGGALWL